MTVRIERCTLQRWAPPDAHFVARVSSGTYIRGLAKSAGDVLGCGAHLTKLRRTEVGPFALRDAVAAEDLVPSSLRPIEPLAGGWPRRDIGAEDWEALRHGRPVRDAGEPGTVTLFIDGRLSGIAEIEGGALRPRVILTGS